MKRIIKYIREKYPDANLEIHRNKQQFRYKDYTVRVLPSGEVTISESAGILCRISFDNPKLNIILDRMILNDMRPLEYEPIDWARVHQECGKLNCLERRSVLNSTTTAIGIKSVHNIRGYDEYYSSYMSQVAKEKTLNKFYCKNQKDTFTNYATNEDDY